jgi:hypothetical protein
MKPVDVAVNDIELGGPFCDMVQQDCLRSNRINMRTVEAEGAWPYRNEVTCSD